MSNEAPTGRPRSSSSLIALVVAIAVVVLYFLNTGGMAWLLPEQYNVVLTPTPSVAQDEAAFVQGDAGGAPDAASALSTTSPVTATPAAEAVAHAAPAEAPAESPTAAPTKAPAVAPTKAPTATPSPTMPATINGLPTIAWDDLPPEAQDTIALIDQGGPFPYDRDGITFQNREGLLPQEPNGFYKEYTVETPGSSDRGARRIIEGQDGVLYYTDDHYESFSVVVR